MPQPTFNFKKHQTLFLLIIGFTILYAIISFVNHYNFRTHALDLGFYTHALYKYAHFQLADNSMIKPFYEPMLGGHFDLYLILFSPFIFVLGTYTLLVIQIIAVIIGGYGVYRYFELKTTGNSNIPILGALYFYTFFGVFSAFS